MIRVVHLTTVHRLWDVRIFHKQAVSLARAGFEVTLIACADKADVREGVRLVPLPPPGSRWERMTLTAWRAYRAALRQRAAICHFHDPELILVGLLLKLHGWVVFYDVHEDVAKDLADKAYIPSPVRPLLKLLVRAFEGLASLCFDRIIAATGAIARNFPARKTTLIRNFPLLDELATASPVPFSSRPRWVVYAGGLAPLNGTVEMVAAMAMLPPESGIRLQLAGKFVSAELEAEVRRHPGWALVDYHGWVSRPQMAKLFEQSRGALVVYQPTPNILECEPNKFFEVLSAGLPLVASNLPLWESFIQEEKCGLVVDATSPRSIAQAIERLVNAPDEAEQMGTRGRIAVSQRYNWESERRKLLDAYFAHMPGPSDRIDLQ